MVLGYASNNMGVKLLGLGSVTPVEGLALQTAGDIVFAIAAGDEG